MSEFGDISRMDLSKLDSKGFHTEEEEDLEETESQAEADETGSRAGTDEAGFRAEADGTGSDPEAELALAASVGDPGHAEREAEAADTEVRMPDPVGTCYYIDAKITSKEMTAFLFAHNYRSPLMLAATVIGLVWPVYSVIKADGNLMMAVICVLIFVVLMPFSIWRRGTTSIKTNPLYENIFHYMLDDKGLHLLLADHLVDVGWNQVTRTMFLKSSSVIYTGKVNAYLIPTEAMGDKKDEINRFIKDHVSLSRMR